MQETAHAKGGENNLVLPHEAKTQWRSTRIGRR